MHQRFRLGGVVLAGCGIAVVFGMVLPFAPALAIAAVALAPLAFGAPTAALLAIVAITVLVPFDVQDSFAVLGGRDQPGLLVVDVLLILGLARLGWLLAQRRLPIDRTLLVGIVVGAVFAAALGWGLVLGASTSDAGHEARRMVLGVGTFLLALPIVRDSDARRRLGVGALGIGLALGLWGIAQWMFDVGYTAGGDVGIRPGVDLTSAAHGQLQGGMYAFGVAVILAWSMLLTAAPSAGWLRIAILIILGINGICLILTFERSLWVATVIGCTVVAVTAGPGPRRLAMKWAAAGLVALVAAAVVFPAVARTTVERLASVGQLGVDTSLSARVVESEAVIDAIIGRPLSGSGFGATITWGQRDVFATQTTPFSHNGYLWLAWKLGVPAAIFVVGVIAAAVLRRTAQDGPAPWRALHRGARAAVLSLLLVAVFFPVFNVLGIGAAAGVLLAVCCSPPEGLT